MKNEKQKPISLLTPHFIDGRWSILLGLTCLTLVDLLQLLVPRVIKHAVDGLAALNIDEAALLRNALTILALALAMMLFRYIWRLCLIGMSRKVEMKLRDQLFRHIQTMSASFFQKTKTGDLMAHATNDLQNVRMAIGMGMVALTDGVLLGTAAIAFMAYIDLELTVLALIPMPLIVFAARMFSGKMHRRYKQVQASFADVTEAVRENFSGIRLIHAYGMEAEAAARVDETSRDYIRQNLRLTRVTGSFFPMMVLFSNVSMAILLIFGGRQTILRTISPGDFVAFISYLGLLTWPMMAMGWVTNLIQRGRASLDRIHRILAAEPDIREAENAESVTDLQSAIVYEGIHYHYPSSDTEGRRDEAIRGVSVTLRRGEILGIVGPPGSGKSSMVRLLPRIDDVRSGCITIDGIDVRNIRLENLRALIDYMPQEPFLFSGSVRENITFGAPAIDEDRLFETIQNAALDDLIDRLPDGLDTRIGERGVILSGGQKQRLALARALLRDAPILVLDDPVSQVDTETAGRIIATIAAMRGRKTIIIVSHRIAALRFADNILTLEAGQVVESGRHDELMAANGYYARICRLQELEEAFHAS